MALVRRSVNILNAIDGRRLSYIPEHFSRMTLRTSVSQVDRWIYQNLDSRYAIVSCLRLDSDNKLVTVHELGVEDPKELTMLSLSCPYLDKN